MAGVKRKDLDILILLPPGSSVFHKHMSSLWSDQQMQVYIAFGSFVHPPVRLSDCPPPGGDAGGLSREYVLRIPSVS